MRVIIATSSRKLRGKPEPNPKDYPYANDLVDLLQSHKITTIQVRGFEDPILNTNFVKSDLPFADLKNVIMECDTFIAVDNYFQHCATYCGKRGIVIFSQSDPVIFGHAQNINLLKDRKYLRSNQFGLWEEATCIPEAFIMPDVVMKELKQHFLM